MTDEVTQLREQVAAQTQTIVAMTLEGAVRDGRMMPAQREQFHKRYGTGGTVADAQAWIASAPRPPERFARHGRPTTHGTDAGFAADGPDGRLVAMTRQHIQKHLEMTQGRERLSFDRAAQIVAHEVNRSDPGLLRGWLEMPGEV
jgi:hypothetical protein